MKSRRAVGGLISLIGLVVVFGIVAVAFLSLNTYQASLFVTQQHLNELQHDRNSEKLMLGVLNCKYIPDNKTHVAQINITISNTWAETSRITSFLVLRDNPMNVTDAQETWTNVTKGDHKIFFKGPLKPGFALPSIRSYSSSNFTITNDTQISTDKTGNGKNATKIMVVTELGNKLIDSFNFTKDCK